MPRLSHWYANPLTEREADRLLTTAEARRRERLLRNRSCFSCELLLLVAHFWQGRTTAEEYAALGSRPEFSTNRRARALLHMVYGQLLMSRRLDGGHERLAAAFAEARHLFAPADYFKVLQRHRHLQALPLGVETQAADTLEGLLKTARVISRMTPSDCPGSLRDQKDICG